MEQDGAHEYNEQGTIFFRIPTPKATPRLVGPYSAKDCPYKAEEDSKAGDSIDNGAEYLSRITIEFS